MIWALGLIAPFLVFAALINFRVRAKRRALHPIQVQVELCEATQQVAPPGGAGATQQTTSTIKNAQPALQELRRLMEEDDAKLFVPLQVALIELIKVGRSLQDLRNTEQDLIMLEARLLAFEKVASIAVAKTATAVDNDLQNLLRAISVVVLRVWTAFTTDVTSGQSPESVQDSDEIRDLIQLLESMMEIFEFDDMLGAEERMVGVCQRLASPASQGTINSRLSASIVNQNNNTTFVFGNGLVTNNNWAINIIRIAKEQEDAIRSITSLLGDQFVSEAADDTQPSTAGCMAGTRTHVLSKLLAWAISDSQKIIWLAGMAGTGKSTIALTLCRMLRNEPAVFFGGGFFCSRSSGSIAQMDVRRVVPTLARLMAGNSSEFAAALAAELDKHDRVAFKSVHEQIGPLLRRPISALASSSRPIIFVIDALDELSNEGELAQLLGLVADFQSQVPVKFILTSRPEMHIRGTPIANPEHNTILKLHAIDPEEVQDDIRRYIDGTLGAVARVSPWFTAADVDTLVKLSNGLFIFASTALKYVLDPDDDDARSARLRRATSAVVQGTAATTSLDTMYELVITGASRSSTMDAEELEELKSILACILTSRMSLTVQALADLIEHRPGILRSSLRRLHAVVHVPDDNDTPGLRTLHASFGDYLFSRAPAHICIPRLLGHITLAQGCLNTMDQRLYFNVSQSPSSYVKNSSTKPVSITLSLEYACLQWVHHVAASDAPTFDVAINQKFRPKLLFWLEVLSVLHKIGLASGLLRIAGSISKDPAVLQFLRDANFFVASSREAIEWSAPHIYLSALPFAHKTSLVYQEFVPLYTGLITAEVLGIAPHGGNALMTLTCNTIGAASVAYSADGRLLGSSYSDGTIHIWDTSTGEEVLSPLTGGDGLVHSVSFARNNRWIASGTGAGVVCIWNVTPGRTSHRRLTGHSGGVNCVAFSLDSSLLASASDDQTARLWNSETGEQLLVMSGHTDRVTGVAFTLAGKILASISHDRTVRRWYVSTGQDVGEPIAAGGWNTLDAWPEGSIIAATCDEGVALWQCQTGEIIATLEAPSLIRSIRFSPDGRSLVAAHGRDIRVWTIHPNPAEATCVDIRGYSYIVKAVAYSPDGMHIAMGSDDGVVRILDAGRSQSVVQLLPSHTASINSLAVSRDNSFIVSGSWDKSVRVWDAHTGEPLLSPLHGHTEHVRSVVISPDGSLIASASADHTVRLWDVKSGEAMGEPMRGHMDIVNAVAFSNDGRWLASAARDKTVQLWVVATRKTLDFGPLECQNWAHAVTFSPDDGIVAGGDEGGFIYLWSTETGNLKQEALQTEGIRVLSLAFSPDGARILSGGDNGTSRIWDICTGQCILVLQGHTSFVWSVAWSHNGRHISTGSYDNSVRLWDAATGAPLATIHGHAKRVNGVAFTRDGKYIVSVSEDCSIRKWDVDAACRAASTRESDPTAALASAKLHGAWLVGPSDQLLLWVPVEYRNYVQAALCTLQIGRSRVVIRADDNCLHTGADWSSCWRN